MQYTYLFRTKTALCDISTKRNVADVMKTEKYTISVRPIELPTENILSNTINTILCGQ